MSSVPLLNSSQLSMLALEAAKVDLNKDFAGACLRWELSCQVGHVIKSMTPEQIEQLGKRTGGLSCVRILRGDNSAYWQDLSRALTNADSAGIDLSLVASLFNPPIADRATA